MKSKTVRLILAAGLLICPALAEETSVNSIMTLNMKCYYQQSGTPSGTVGAGKVGVFRVDSKQLLKLAANQLGISFPNGTRLLATADGGVFAVNSKGDVIRDLSAYFLLKRDTANLLFDGRSKQPAGQQTSRNYYPVTFTMNLAGLTGTVGGLLIETFKITAPDKFGVRRISSDSNTPVSGKGTYGNSLSYYEGDLKLSGKTALIRLSNPCRHLHDTGLWHLAGRRDASFGRGGLAGFATIRGSRHKPARNPWSGKATARRPGKSPGHPGVRKSRWGNLPELPPAVLSPHPPGSVENQNWITGRIAELDDAAWSDDPESMRRILAELRNPQPEIRAAARAAITAFGSREAVPYLEMTATTTYDETERQELSQGDRFPQAADPSGHLEGQEQGAGPSPSSEK